MSPRKKTSTKTKTVKAQGRKANLLAKNKPEKSQSAGIPKSILKRDGRIVAFDAGKVENAVFKAMKATGEWKEGLSKKVGDAVLEDLKRIYGDKGIPTVEEIQDLVEKQLILNKFSKTAKAYILYRYEHSKLREQTRQVPQEVRDLVAESKSYFRNTLSEYVFYSTYARWLPEKGRRETWVEAIDRYMDFMRENVGSKLSEKDYAEVRQGMLEMKVAGSMRLLWAAGKAARSTNVAAYNCSFIAPRQWRDFGEVMYLLMCGSGVGYSVERQHVETLPMVARQTGSKQPTHVVTDSREGWADALIAGLETWAKGEDLEFDYTQVRPRGARLSTMGGRASGPEPLMKLLDFTRAKMIKRQGRRLSTLDVHDIVCMIGEIVVAGGVRRSALISLSDLDDVEMREAKNGQFYITNPQRSMANNSAVYNEKPTMAQFMDEWHNLAASGSGERGIFNRGGLPVQVPERRMRTLEKDLWNTGLNPCGEIVLKSKQFCNLTVAVVHEEDTEKTLLEKVRLATIIGTYQASLTHFPYLSYDWKRNAEEEALLGVSLTGTWDNPVSRDPKVLAKMKEVAIETNKKYAKKIGINPSAAITTMKPSGNSSQLFDTASGLHPRHAKYYIRRVRVESHNPLFQMLKESGVPVYPEVGQDPMNANTWVLEFPVKAPEQGKFKDEISALDLLSHWKDVKTNYTEHNPSATISVGDDEWLEVGNWVYKNWDIIGGLSFLPRSNHVYKLAPYEAITKEQYEERAKRFPNIDFADLYLYEQDDATTGAKEYACVSGACEVDPIPEEAKEESK